MITSRSIDSSPSPKLMKTAPSRIHIACRLWQWYPFFIVGVHGPTARSMQFNDIAL
jgi:hypothetical protein